MEGSKEEKIQRAVLALGRIRDMQPLIHCITSPIAINDCANGILALGGRPVMAEHPNEVRGITALAAGLSVSLANITDARAESLMLSGKEARERGIPCVIDMVGVNCSPFRMEIARDFLTACRPAVVKGNASELRALFGVSHGKSGIDTAESDRVDLSRPGSAEEMSSLMKRFALSEGCCVLVSGAADLLTDGNAVWAVKNGVPELGKITGTGCLLSCLTALTLSVAKDAEGCTDALTAGLLSAGVLGIAGELALEAVISNGHGRKGADGVTDGKVPLGKFHMRILDALGMLEPEGFADRARIHLIEEEIP